MKKLNLGPKEVMKSRLDRNIISTFGNSIYLCPEVESIRINVRFKDGSSIGFNKDEDLDDIGCLGEE